MPSAQCVDQLRESDSSDTTAIPLHVMRPGPLTILALIPHRPLLHAPTCLTARNTRPQHVARAQPRHMSLGFGVLTSLVLVHLREVSTITFEDVVVLKIISGHSLRRHDTGDCTLYIGL